MTVEEWQEMLAKQPPKLRLYFQNTGDDPIGEGAYADGNTVRAGRSWEGRHGWQPCLLVHIREV